eukprot:1582391-Pleurochrysis_carterae.AAC.1
MSIASEVYGGRASFASRGVPGVPGAEPPSPCRARRATDRAAAACPASRHAQEQKGWRGANE